MEQYFKDLGSPPERCYKCYGIIDGTRKPGAGRCECVTPITKYIPSCGEVLDIHEACNNCLKTITTLIDKQIGKKFSTPPFPTEGETLFKDIMSNTVAQKIQEIYTYAGYEVTKIQKENPKMAEILIILPKYIWKDS